MEEWREPLRVEKAASAVLVCGSPLAELESAWVGDPREPISVGVDLYVGQVAVLHEEDDTDQVAAWIRAMRVTWRPGHDVGRGQASIRAELEGRAAAITGQTGRTSSLGLSGKSVSTRERPRQQKRQQAAFWIGELAWLDARTVAPGDPSHSHRKGEGRLPEVSGMFPEEPGTGAPV